MHWNLLEITNLLKNNSQVISCNPLVSGILGKVNMSVADMYLELLQVVIFCSSSWISQMAISV